MAVRKTVNHPFSPTDENHPYRPEGLEAGLPTTGIRNFVPRSIMGDDPGAAPAGDAFSITPKPPAPPPVDPDVVPFNGNYGYVLKGTGQTPATGGSAPELNITGTFTLLDGVVITSDTEHPSDNRKGQDHGWNPFADFQVARDADTNAMQILLLGHWHAGTGQNKAQGGPPSPIGPYFDGTPNVDRSRFTLNAQGPSAQALTGEAIRQS